MDLIGTFERQYCLLEVVICKGHSVQLSDIDMDMGHTWYTFVNVMSNKGGVITSARELPSPLSLSFSRMDGSWKSPFGYFMEKCSALSLRVISQPRSVAVVMFLKWAASYSHLWGRRARPAPSSGQRSRLSSPVKGTRIVLLYVLSIAVGHSENQVLNSRRLFLLTFDDVDFFILNLKSAGGK